MKFIIYFITFLSIISLIYSACTGGQVNVSGGTSEICGTGITDCKTYDAESSAATPLCAVCDNSKVPAENKQTCVECASGKETKDGKTCHTKITDCAEYDKDSKCVACTGKIPKSDGSACEACPDGKETKDGKTCVDKSASSFVKISIFALLCLFALF